MNEYFIKFTLEIDGRFEQRKSIVRATSGQMAWNHVVRIIDQMYKKCPELDDIKFIGRIDA